MLVSTPKSFAVVEPRLYRSTVFSRENFSFIRLLKLRTVLYLSSEEAPKALRDFCQDEEITYINLGTTQPYSRSGDWSPLRGDLAKVALETVLDSSKLPLLIVCLSGVQQTGALVGCLRRLQGWSFTSTIEEHRRFCDVSSRSNVEHFIEVFDVDMVTLPKSLPEWFAADMAASIEEETNERKKRGSSS